MANNVNFSVFVENGMDYRNGGMTGAWFDLPMSDEELVEAFAKIGVKYSEDDCILNRDYVITDFEKKMCCKGTPYKGKHGSLPYKKGLRAENVSHQTLFCQFSDRLG